MKNKRIVAIILCAVVVFTVITTGCVSQGGETKDTGKSDTGANMGTTSIESTALSINWEDLLKAEAIPRLPVKQFSYDLTTPPAAIIGKPAPAFDFWFEESQKLINTDTQREVHLSKSGDSSNYAWGTSYVMRSLYTAYTFTLDEGYLETYALVCANMYDTLADNDGDGYLGWGTGNYSGGKYDEYAVHTGFALKGWADFIQLVQADPSLGDKQVPTGGSYLELANKLLDAANNHLVPSFERDYNRHLGIYMNRPGSGNWNGITQEKSLPHNQYLAFAVGLYGMASVSPDNTFKYTLRADELLSSFKSFLWIDENGQMMWQYDDAFFYGDGIGGGPEDFSHAMMDYFAAIECYNRGGVFEYSDLAAFAYNLQTFMFNKDYDNPSVGESVGSSGSGNVPYIYNICLARYGDMVWQICAKSYNGRLSDAALLMSLHPDAPAPESFALTAPMGTMQGNGPLTFMWTPSKYASDYCLQISTKEDFGTLLVDRPYITNTAAIVDVLKDNTKYHWRVIARSASGKTIQSDVGTLTTGTSENAVKRVLSFDFMAQVPEEGTCWLRVALSRRLIYNLPLQRDEGWHSVEIDMTEALKNYPEASLRFSIYRDAVEGGEAELYIDNVALTGAGATVNFDETAGYTGIYPYDRTRSTSARFNGLTEGMSPDGSSAHRLHLAKSSGIVFGESFLSIGFSLN